MAVAKETCIRASTHVEYTALTIFEANLLPEFCGYNFNAFWPSLHVAGYSFYKNFKHIYKRQDSLMQEERHERLRSNARCLLRTKNGEGSQNEKQYQGSTRNVEALAASLVQVHPLHKTIDASEIHSPYQSLSQDFEALNSLLAVRLEEPQET